VIAKTPALKVATTQQPFGPEALPLTPDKWTFEPIVTILTDQFRFPRLNAMHKTWKALKKESLMKIVVQLLSREGLNGLTMDAIAREAGVAKGTIYTYFRNKQDLVKEAIEATILPMIEMLNDILKSELSPDRKLTSLTLNHLLYYEQHRDFFGIFVHDRQAASQRLKRYRSCHYQQFLESVASVIQDGIDKQIFRNRDPNKLAAMLIEADIAIIFQRLLSEQSGPVEEDASLITETFLHGIQRT
jgi:AcrR family transcriptional regulator